LQSFSLTQTRSFSAAQNGVCYRNRKIPTRERIVKAEKIALIHRKYDIALSSGPAREATTVHIIRQAYKYENKVVKP